ncbi:MAG: phosphoribosyltransferase family protein [Acidimicrobiales bacterium]
MDDHAVLDLGAGLAVVAVWAHSGAAADLVRELKYGRATTVVTELAEAMVAVAPSADLVSWVPASPARRRQRGFDQGELLARAVARRLGMPVRRALRRVDDEPQTSRGREGRLLGPRFGAAGRRMRFGPTVLLIDDVVTTGSTLRAAAAVLRDHGAGQVRGLAATHAVASPVSADAPAAVYHLATTRPTGG